MRTTGSMSCTAKSNFHFMNSVSRIQRSTQQGRLKAAQKAKQVSVTVWNFYKKKMPSIKTTLDIILQVINLASAIITIAHFLQAK